MNLPEYAAMTKSGTIWVADSGNKRMQLQDSIQKALRETLIYTGGPAGIEATRRLAASGFPLKDVAAESLFDAVRIVASGEALLPHPSLGGSSRNSHAFTPGRPLSPTCYIC